MKTRTHAVPLQCAGGSSTYVVVGDKVPGLARQRVGNHKLDGVQGHIDDQAERRQGVGGWGQEE